MTIVFVLIGAAMIVSALLALYAWLRRPTPSAGPFAWLMLSVAWWSFGVYFGIASQDLPTKLIWAKIVFFSITTVPVFWTAFIIEYTGNAHWLSPRNLLLAFIEPIITLILAWTNEWHGLIYTSTRLDLSSGYPMVQSTFGTWVWVHTVYAYGLMLTGTLLLVWTAIRLQPVYRRQIIVLLLGSLIPWVSNIISIAGLSPLPTLDLTPIAFTLSGIVFAWGLSRFGLLNLVPVARDLVIEQLSDGIMVLDARDRIMDANPALERIAEMPMKQLIGRSVDLVISQWTHLVPLNQNTPIRFQITRNSNDKEFAYDMHVSPLFDQRRRLTGRVVTLRDVSDLTRAEQALKQAKESAEASELAKSNFLATMSYELRTPLTTIAGYSHALLAEAQQQNPRQSARNLEQINNASQHLLALVNKLLDLTRIDMKTATLALKTFDLVGLVRETIKAIQPEAEKKKNTIRLNAPEALGVYLDKEKARQIIQTIIENAVTYTQSGQITIDVRRETDQDLDWIILSVQDTGRGIASHHLSEIFEPFTQADRTAVREFGHTGLSLAISQRYCKLMHGTIDVVSELGKGSVVTVRLPANIESLQT